MRKVAVGDVMTVNYVSVDPEDDLYKCARVLVKEKLDSLLVAREKKLVGILIARDILWAITKKNVSDLRTIKALDIATRKVAVIKPSADISEAFGKMRNLNFRRLPVISNGQLVGVITLKDILAIEPEFYSEMRSFLDIREEKRKIQQAGAAWPLEGFCENCGAFSELLKVGGKLLCVDCRDELY